MPVSLMRTRMAPRAVWVSSAPRSSGDQSTTIGREDPFERSRKTTFASKSGAVGGSGGEGQPVAAARATTTSTRVTIIRISCLSSRIAKSAIQQR